MPVLFPRRFPSLLLPLAILGLWPESNAGGQTPYATAISASTVQEEIPANRGAAAVWQSLKKLNTRASLVMIVAHPDDEDGSTLTYESRGRGTRVALVTLNRGEGGANVMSPDFFDALGLVRTMELLRAGQHYGVDQYWTRLVDYGFSKTKAESIGKWTHARVLADTVRLIRTIRPLVVTSVFIGGPSDGHGNHETAGAVAQEVMRAAADPRAFPEQIAAGLRPWQPLKDYARVPFRQRGAAAQVTVPHGAYDPLLGASYTQLAREGLGYQKSQVGGGSVPRRGAASTGYLRLAPPAAAGEKEDGFFAGIDVTLAGIATLAGAGDAGFLRTGLAEVQQHVDEARRRFAATAPEACAPALARGLQATDRLLAAVAASALPERARLDVQHELRIKRAQFEAALAEALGLAVYGTLAPETEPSPMQAMFLGDGETARVVIPGQKIGIKARAVATAPGVRLERLRLDTAGAGGDWQVAAPPEASGRDLAPNEPVEGRFAATVPADAQATRPYFSRPDIEQPYYDIRDESSLFAPLAPYPVAVWGEFGYAGVTVRAGQVVQTVRRVTGQGAVYEPLLAGPAIGVAIAPGAGVVPLAQREFPVTVTIHSNVKGPAQGTVRLALPDGWRAQPAEAQFATRADGENVAVAFTVVPEGLAARPYEIAAVASYGGREYREGYSMTGYPGLRPYPLYRAATHRTSGVDVRMAGNVTVGYVTGTGDEVPAALEQLGVKAQFLSAADLATGDLGRFEMIVLGVRAYAAREELKTYNARLLEYVRNGGVLMAQYNTPEYNQGFGPFAYDMGLNPEEVTDEASHVEILKPDHPVFQWPNRITARDFEGWVEERGSKWMKTWDPQWEALLETHDAGQEPQRGGLLYARYGKGVYLYNAYAFYRQLPEGVPGAFRIFANLLSLPKNPRIR